MKEIEQFGNQDKVLAGVLVAFPELEADVLEYKTAHLRAEAQALVNVA